MTTPTDEESIALRVNDLDATRGTEQCAIALALAAGRIELREKIGRPRDLSPSAKVELFALELVLGYLGQMACDAAVDGIYFEANKETAVEKKSSILSAASKRLGEVKVPDARWKLSFLIAPVDRMKDFDHGLPGVISAIAGGSPGSFTGPTRESYLVIAGKPGWELSNTEVEQGTPFEVAIQQCIGGARDEAVMGCLLSIENRQYPLATNGRLRVFSGSPIVGAIAALRGRSGVDLFAAQVGRVEAIMIAIAAQATRGGFAAVPLDPDGASAGERLNTEDFIASGADVFLVATGITDSIVLRGVRFSATDRVETQTMCLRTATHSTRFVTHHHALCEKRFRVWNSTTIELIKFPEIQSRITQCLDKRP